MSTRELAASTPVPTAVLPGVVTGAASALCAMAVYQLFRLGFWAAGRITVHAGQGGAPGMVSPARFIGSELLPSLISLGPTLLAGALIGGFVGLVITETWGLQSPLRSAFTGSVVTFVAAFVVNTVVLTRTRRNPLGYARWTHLLGYPSVVFVLVFAGVGASLYVSRARLAAVPTSFDLRNG